MKRNLPSFILGFLIAVPMISLIFGFDVKLLVLTLVVDTLLLIGYSRFAKHRASRR